LKFIDVTAKVKPSRRFLQNFKSLDGEKRLKSDIEQIIALFGYACLLFYVKTHESVCIAFKEIFCFNSSPCFLVKKHILFSK